MRRPMMSSQRSSLASRPSTPSSDTSSSTHFSTTRSQQMYSSLELMGPFRALINRKLNRVYSPHGASPSSMDLKERQDMNMSVSKVDVQDKVMQLLDQLTEGNFIRTAAQILGWANISINERDGSTLRLVCELVVKRGVDEVKGTRLHVQLCRYITLHLTTEVADVGTTGTDGKPISGGLLFRKYLLNQCQLMFEHLWPTRKRKLKPAQRQAIPKPQSLGLIRFISRLYNISARSDVMLLNERIVHRCIHTILLHCKQKKPTETAIKSACMLLLTTAAKLDNGDSSKDVDKHISRMQKLKLDPRVSPLMQQTLQYIIDLRVNHGWVSPVSGGPLAAPPLWTRQSENTVNKTRSPSSVNTIAIYATFQGRRRCKSAGPRW